MSTKVVLDSKRHLPTLGHQKNIERGFIIARIKRRSQLFKTQTMKQNSASIAQKVLPIATLQLKNLTRQTDGQELTKKIQPAEKKTTLQFKLAEVLKELNKIEQLITENLSEIQEILSKLELK